MRCKSLRSILASLLILAFAITLLPTITANAGQSTPSTRRGKNGGAPGKAESPPLARNPQPAPASQADLNLEGKQRVRRLGFLTPEAEQPAELKFEQTGSRLHFRVPEFLVYGVVRVHL